MDYVLREYLWKFVVVYLDDINIFSNTFDEHLEYLRKIFNKLRQANLKLQPEKCFFIKKELAFLGHIISKEGIKPDPAKIDKVQQYPVPKNLTQIRAFLGLASYYRRFIKDFLSIAKPLNYLLKKDIPYIWTQEQ